MTIYVVTSGEYSDYHINAVFTDRKQAELYCAVTDSQRSKYDSDFCSIEEYETDETKVEGKVYYGLSFYANVYEAGISVSRTDQVYSLSPVIPKIDAGRTYGGYKYLQGTIPVNRVYDDDDKREKIVKDYLAKMQAEKEGLI